MVLVASLQLQLVQGLHRNTALPVDVFALSTANACACHQSNSGCLTFSSCMTALELLSQAASLPRRSSSPPLVATVT